MSERDYLFLQSINQVTGGQLRDVLNRNDPNLTVCPRCRVDDFVHVEGCPMSPPRGEGV